MMRLLHCSNDGGISLVNHLADNDETPPYAIMSHTWGADTDEVTFEDLTQGVGEDKPGYKKIKFCGEQALRDGLNYFWIDTCCINKTNQVELQSAINSMFRFYSCAARCYVFLSDVSVPGGIRVIEDSQPTWETEFRASRWFTRGWTLQELLAPRSDEFFSQEWTKLGNKTSLRRHIRESTGISDAALSGSPLSQFSVNERLSWSEHRKTKLEEDRAYCLVGIFGVHISPFYGEGAGGAFRRLMDEVDKLSKCLQDLHLTNPHDDKKRIESTKGGLLEGSYHWVLDNSNFQQWRNDSQSRLLWIKGDPGKGKTMLLCGIINELEKSTHNFLSFFFCQGTDSRNNSATAVLRGLIYLLVNQQPSLISHLRKKYDQAGSSVFEDANAWFALSDIFADMIRDPTLKTSYLVVDALDECMTDLPKLLNLIIHTLGSPSRVKWLLSSRNEAQIELKLRAIDHNARLSLELKQNAMQVSGAVDLYIDHKLSLIDSLEDSILREQVRSILRRKASGTFLWVALMVQELERPETWDPLQVVEEAPSGLYQLYDRMVDRVQQLTKRNSEICKLLLSIATVAYRPVYLSEMGSLCRLSGSIPALEENVRKLVTMCGSFLTIRDNQIYLIHQSAKDYLGNKMGGMIFPSQDEIHHTLFSQSLKLMFASLKRDMYNLLAPGFPITEVQVPVPDPLAKIRYSCLYWVDHLCCSVRAGTKCYQSLQDDENIYKFLYERYLYWLEALSLCKHIPSGVRSMAKLEGLVQGTSCTVRLTELIRDARRFVMYHKNGIQNSPLQTYVTALLFSPVRSRVRNIFKHEEPKQIRIRPDIRDNWSSCLQTLEGHVYGVSSVVFSHDSTLLASGSYDSTVKLWDTTSGECLHTLEGHIQIVCSVAFSHDSTLLASGSYDRTVKLWDSSSGECLHTLEGHSSFVYSVAFSHNSAWLASASSDKNVKIWDISSRESLLTLEGHSDGVRSVAFSHDSALLTSASLDGTIKIWDTDSSECLETLMGHSAGVMLVAFSHDSALLASASADDTIKIWDTSSGGCLHTLKGHSDSVFSVAFSHNSAWLASASSDKTVKIWDISSRESLLTFEGHSDGVNSVAFSHDSTLLVSASTDHTVKVWDTNSSECLERLEGYDEDVTSVAFSHDSALLALKKWNYSVKIRETSSGECLHTLEGHRTIVMSMAFSHDSALLASASMDGTIKLWDTNSGECLQTLEGHNNTVNLVTFSHNSALLASTSSEKAIKLWDTSSGECLHTIKSNFRYVYATTFSHNSAWLASVSSDKAVMLWDTSTGECLKKLGGHRRSINSVAFSHDSALLASASRDRTVNLWDTTSGECLHTLKGHGKSVDSVTFSHDSTLLVSASADAEPNLSGSAGVELKLWVTNRGECLQTFNVGLCNRVSFGMDNSYLQTDSRTIDISGLSIPSSSSKYLESQTFKYQGIGLSRDGVWITCNSENLLWLPLEYRRAHSNILSGTTINILARDGRIWTCAVELDKAF